MDEGKSRSTLPFVQVIVLSDGNRKARREETKV